MWVNEWLTGTVRFQLTASQRGIWADLLALAGASRHPGFIVAGETNGKLDPYPMDYLCGLFRCDEEFLKKTLKLFERQERITNNQGVIGIVNWSKYQSEYHQKRERKSVRDSESVSQMSEQKSATVEREVEVDIEVDGEEDERVKLARALFEKFWIDYPKKLDKDEAFREWLNLSPIDWDKAAESIQLWAKSEEWSEPKFVPAPVTFIKKRRWESKPVQKKKEENQYDKARRMEREAGL